MPFHQAMDENTHKDAMTRAFHESRGDHRRDKRDEPTWGGDLVFRDSADMERDELENKIPWYQEGEDMLPTGDTLCGHGCSCRKCERCSPSSYTYGHHYTNENNRSYGHHYTHENNQSCSNDNMCDCGECDCGDCDCGECDLCMNKGGISMEDSFRMHIPQDQIDYAKKEVDDQEKLNHIIDTVTKMPVFYAQMILGHIGVLGRMQHSNVGKTTAEKMDVARAKLRYFETLTPLLRVLHSVKDIENTTRLYYTLNNWLHEMTELGKLEAHALHKGIFPIA
jgi:hypothetical protein